MKPLFLVKSIKAFFLLFFLLLGAIVWGQSPTTYTFDSASWGASPADWTSGENGLFVSGRGVQITSNLSGAYGNSPISFSSVSKVVITYSTNATNGVGTIRVNSVSSTGANANTGTQVGSTFNVTKPSSGGTTDKVATFTPSSTLTGFIQVYVTCTTNSIYIKSVEITYSSGPSITTTTPISGAPFCVTSTSGATVSVPYTISGTFNSGNIFTAQLSNASGSFTSPTNIGTRTATNAGSISANIPAGTATGTGYKIRVIASNPSTTGSETAAFAINLRSSNIAPTTVQNIMAGNNGSLLTSTATGATARQWKYSTVAGGPYTNIIAGATGNTYTPNFNTPGTYYVVCETTFVGCGAVASNAVRINVTSAIATLTVNPTSLSGFTYSESNGPSAIQSFVLSGSNLEDTASDPVELVTIIDDFEISENPTGPWGHSIELPASYVGANKTIYVRLKAGLPVGSGYEDSVLISGGGTVTASFAEVALSGSVTACLAPTTQSVVSSFNAVGINGMTVNLTAGNGVGRVVVINTNNSFTNPITSNTLPTANTVYSGSGQQVIYAGTGNNVSVTGLSPSTTYWYRVYEYNICSGNYTYNTTTPTNNPRSQATLCDVPVMPNGEVDVDPSCGSVDLVYQHGTMQPQAGVSYYWQTSATGTSTANSANNIYTVTTGGKYYVRGYNGSCWGPAFEMNDTVVILSPVTVSTQPANQSATVGATATFAVTASNVSTYQWQVSTNNGTTWSNVPSATSASYTTPVTTLAMNGYRYRVRLSNSCGTITSNVAILTVNNAPVSIWSNEITGTNPGQTSPYTTGDVSHPNITVSGITRGPGIVGSNANNRYTATGWTTSGTLEADDYFEFTITPNANYEINFSSFQYVGQISGGSSRQSFRSSIDNFASDIGSANTTGTTIDLSASTYQNIKDPIIFRFYTYGVSAATRTYSINDFDFTGNVVSGCTPATITAFPTSGPANTIVTLSGTDFGVTSTVKFGTANATVEYISATELKVTVPATADGNIIVDTALDCDSETAFTLIKEDISSCQSSSGGTGSVPATDLIIYEVYDENGGTGGTISLYNGTNSAINLSSYILQRAGDYGGAYSNTYITLTGSIAAGQLGLVGVSGSNCTYASTNGSISNGFNADDGFRLVKGSVIIDDVRAPSYVGYYLKRKLTNLQPKSTFDPNDWDETSVDTDECISGVGSSPSLVPGVPPTVVTQPSYAVSCEINNTTLTLTATEGYVGGNALAYQWYVLGTTGNWTVVSNSSVYSGANTATLVINDITGLNNYQYYCQVRENTETCYTATQATQIKEATNTWSATQVWSNGNPILASKVIIEGSYDTQANGALNVCELTVGTTGTMVVKASNPITVKKKIINNNTAADSFVVESDANIIQTDDVANEGNILVQRSVADMNNVSTKMDYVYWSSPVDGQAIKGAAGFSPNTPNSGFQQYNESNDRFAVTNDPTFLKAKGYAIRAESGVMPGSNPPLQYQNGYNKTYTFTGIPNNGSFQSAILGKSGPQNGYNLIGNPYPSNIDFDLLHALNEDKIYATAFFWTNNEYEPTQMGSGYKGNNYAIYNITGGVPATYDQTNPNYDTAPNGKVKVGQAFIVQTKIAGALDFNNSIRVTDNGTFYQKSQAKNRFWLSLTAPNNMVNTILVGYIPGATNLYETDFDAELLAVGSDSFYSVLGARKLAIQGKADSFSTDDVVALGNVFSTNGTYTIKIQNPEGLFNENQNVYLKDKLLNKYINLSTEGSYTFEAVKGTGHTRFEIVYKEGTLDANDHQKSQFEVHRKGADFVIQSSKRLGKVELYDAGGRLVHQLQSNEKNVILQLSHLPQGVYIIKAENSGDVKTKKIIK